MKRLTLLIPLLGAVIGCAESKPQSDLAALRAEVLTLKSETAQLKTELAQLREKPPFAQYDLSLDAKPADHRLFEQNSYTSVKASHGIIRMGGTNDKVTITGATSSGVTSTTKPSTRPAEPKRP